MAYWPGMTEEQVESQPGFYNDCHAWGEWMAERESEPETLDAIRKLKADSILTHTTNGMKEAEVQWVTPTQLRKAVVRLRDAVREEKDEIKIILKTYERNANGVDPVSDEFVRDLDDIEAIANWAEEEGATRMTLEVNW